MFFLETVHQPFPTGFRRLAPFPLGCAFLKSVKKKILYNVIRITNISKHERHGENNLYTK